MFYVIYEFEVKPNSEAAFKQAWFGLTKLFYQYEGSYGSRLHKVPDKLFIAYAGWPSRATWENSGRNLPDNASHFRNAMRDACVNISTKYEMNMVEDYLKDNAL
jgi:hypothetical protein